MFMFVLLGLIDVVMSCLMVAMHLGFLDQWRIALIGAVYFVGKGVMFRGSFLSYIDIAAGIYFILVLFGVHTFLVYVFLGIMVYKFLTSLVMRG